MKRMIGVVILFVGFGSLAFWGCQRMEWLTESQVYGSMAAAGWKGALIGMVLLAGDVVLPVPSSVVMTIHGVAYGVIWGTVYSTIGSLGAAGAGYALGRIMGRASVNGVGASPEEVSFAERFFDRFGPYALILSRSVPLFAEVVTCWSGIRRMPAWKFWTATLCGTLPLSGVYAVWGARSGDEGRLLPTLVIAVALPVMGWGILALATRGKEGPGIFKGVDGNVKDGIGTKP